ncbi:hypothetical protein ABUE31_15810 [Mesorhizobium sp. ZMM04-5]|uniref:Uncharacterized protein n=1 Tax=Mesorhizobium marinum TaxID=3228790 RepID=A0ABV3R296_9HYPH
MRTCDDLSTDDAEAQGRRGKAGLEGNTPARKPEQALVEAVAKAHVQLRKLTDGSGQTIADVARDLGMHGADVSRILPLAFLAPKVTDAILRGRQPVDLTARTLVRDDLPHLWADQLRQFAL